jgi:hypothetical protein
MTLICGIDAGTSGVAPEDFAVAAKTVHPFLDARAARVDQADDRRPFAERQVHHPTDFARLHFPKRPAEDGEILRVDEYRAPVDPASAGHDAITVECLAIDRSAGGVGFQLLKTAAIKQEINALTSGQFTTGMVASDALWTAALPRAFAHGAQFQHPRILPGRRLIACVDCLYSRDMFLRWSAIGLCHHSVPPDMPLTSRRHAAAGLSFIFYFTAAAQRTRRD